MSTILVITLGDIIGIVVGGLFLLGMGALLLLTKYGK